MRTLLCTSLILSLYYNVTNSELFTQPACKNSQNLTLCSETSDNRKSTTDEILFNKENSTDNIKDWLRVFLDESTSDDEDGELTNQRHNHTNIQTYCLKYNHNFHNYCSSDRIEELEGVLSTFCLYYKRTCDIADITVDKAPEEKGKTDFPHPPPFTQEFHISKEFTADVDPIKSSQYCQRFSSKFGERCAESTSKSDDFCTSYMENCKSLKPVKHFQESSIESEEFELPPEDDHSLEENTNNKKSSIEGQASDTKQAVSDYCEQYSENYNYFCAGEANDENAKFCASYASNCPQKIESFKSSGSYLGDREKSVPGTSVYQYKGTKKEYCDKFSVNYEYYCKGDNPDVSPDITQKFCPSYRNVCAGSSGPTPADPFSANSGKTKENNNDPDFPDLDNPSKGSIKKSRRRKSKKGKRLRIPRHPCTPDCDQKKHPHCTSSCKCDFIYPYVQKFCNPPPLPLFLNTCRLWYNGCPKYERYHYASQFVYSKAEKGKVIEGPGNTKPFSVISPNGERIPVVLRQPGPGSRLKDDVTIWESDEKIRERLKDDPSLWVLDDSQEKRNKTRRKKQQEYLHNLPFIKFLDEEVKQAIPNFPIPISPKKQEQSDPAQPELLHKQRDSELFEEDVPSLPKDEKNKDAVPVVPSDSVFQNAISQYGAFTDNRGVLHRPRSRSPFTKPGLWEPNPDNPHNRDHANKWYYNPRSVNVDWLGGQIAWGGHWAVPAAGVGGTEGFSTVHFPTIGTFANIPDDYD